MRYKVKFTPKQVHNIMRDLLSAVTYMHENNIIHRDIKLENIRFLKEKIYDHIKILDFGSACIHYPDSQLKNKMAGSPMYASPEMLGLLGYDFKTDVWSCGIIMHVLLVGGFPNDAKNDFTVMQNIQK